MDTRKYFLDWLRVGAFALLILFHVGMLYVSWPYNLKSPRLAPGIEAAMLAFSVWRMPLLFLISGVACRFLIGKLGPGRFALDRLRRLLPVILVGMFVVIPPQTYIELVSKGVTHESYLRFWVFDYLTANQTLVAPLHKTMPTWDHLWFLVYLLDYSLLFALAFGLSRLWQSRSRIADRVPIPLLLILPALWLAACDVWIGISAPITDDLIHDWGGHAKWIGMFVTGLICSTQPRFWTALRDHRGKLALAAIVLLIAQSRSRGVVWSTVSGVYSWAAICAICGYAYRYLDRPSAALSHLNEAVLPIYVLHQPILLIAAYWVFPLKLPLPVEGLTLATITGLGCFAIYETVIRPFAVSRVLFGLKTLPALPRPFAAASQASKSSPTSP
jgi:hypothetical protein